MAKKETIIKECAVCGVKFEINNGLHFKMTCSNECSKIRSRNMSKIYRLQKKHESAKKPRKSKNKKRNDLSVINNKARELGMTYGQYMAQLYINNQSLTRRDIE